MTRYRRYAFTLTATLLLLSCDSGGGVVVEPDSGGDMELVSGEVEGEAVYDAKPLSDLTPDTGCRKEGLHEAEAYDPEECEPGTGCFGELCDGNADCLSGICVAHMGDTVCSQFCVEECPEGWDCKQVGGMGPDASFACVSAFSHLCLPCLDNSGCSTEYVQNVCVEYEGEGFFCGASCGKGEGEECPGGFVCKEVASADGGMSMQCVSVEAVCDCSQTASKLGLATACGFSNEFGTCEGIRVCSEDGLSDCDATVPGPEECNGKDDNCDGQIDESTCDDENSCTEDSCNGELGCQHAKLDSVPCDDGDECSFGDECQAGICVGDNVECNDGEECTDDSCDEDFGCTFEANNAECSDADPCTVGDHCIDGECKAGMVIQCDDGNECTDDQCDEAKGCVHLSNTKVCDDGNACTKGDHCTDGICAGQQYVDCNDSNVCTNDVCDPVQGCQHYLNDASCDDSDMCTLGDKCQEGECLPGKELDCDDGNLCTNDSCNQVVGCVHTNNSNECDDFDPCTVDDYCAGGVCIGSEGLDCSDDNSCTDDYCTPMAGCSHTPNAIACDDGNVCTVGDACKGGACVAGAVSLICDDGNPCTTDHCDPEQGCKFSPADGGPCDDENECTTDDHCKGGKCVSATPVDCDDGEGCTTDICLPEGGCSHVANSAPCNDGDICTIGDICKGSKCEPGEVELPCNDGNLCTEDTCDPESGCQFAPLDGKQCNDGNMCTFDDYCDAGKCVSESSIDCEDDDVCTTDYCDPSIGCIHQLNNNPCNDGDACTAGDACSLGACQGKPLSCDDGNPCTDDSCDALVGCMHVSNILDCDDGNQCTTGDHCLNAFCVAGGMLDCDDANVCTKDSCDPAAGCAYQSMESPCDDGNACTIVDACDNGECVGSGALDCDDGNWCTTDSCDPAAGCKNDAIAPCCGNSIKEAGEECDDGNLNNGDGCDSECKEESGDLQYQGYGTWQQQCSNQSDKQQDDLMDNACKSAFGNSAHAATNPDLIEGKIVGLPGSNNSGHHLLFKCPHCEGKTPYGALEGHARACVNPNSPWPNAYFPQGGWNDHCCSNVRTCVCVK